MLMSQDLPRHEGVRRALERRAMAGCIWQRYKSTKGRLFLTTLGITYTVGYFIMHRVGTPLSVCIIEHYALSRWSIGCKVPIWYLSRAHATVYIVGYELMRYEIVNCSSLRR